MRFLPILFLFLVSLAHAQTDTLTIVSYNLLNFPEGRDDCGSSNTVVPNRADTLRKILRYAKPDIFVACEIQTEAGADSILTRSLNVFGTNSFAAANFHLNSNNSDLHNMLYYNSDKLTLQWQDYIQTSVRDIDHYVLYVNDPNLGQFFDTTFIEVYMCHLKAGSSTANKAERAQQTQLLMDYIATRPTDRNHFVCGDLNVYTSSETCYLQLTSGAYALQDPINSPGNWNSNASFAPIHTQSTRTSGNFDCGSTGGIDDRFDHILVSSNVMTGSDSLRYLVGSYAALGNDGNHYNNSLISSPVNTMYPDSVVRALYYMSDHMPVTLKTVVTYPTSNGLALYPVVQGVSCYGSSDGELTIVANDGQAPYTYLWDANAGNQTTATATGLASGSYCVQVTDALGEVDDYCVFLPQPDSLSYSTFVNPENGTCNGSAYLLLSGGAAPYDVVWNDPQSQTGTAVTNLCTGNYAATVTDANGCVTIIPITINYVGLDEIIREHIRLFPNPTAGDLELHFPIDWKVTTPSVIDGPGRRIPVTSVSSVGVQKIDVRKLTAGRYFLEVTVNDIPYLLPFQKQ